MTRYALLILPAANRVYAQASVRLTRAELEVLDGAVLGGRVRDLEETAIGGVPYVAFSADGLGDRDTAVARRDQLIAVMASNGLQVLDGDAYLQFQHRVDQAIVRDLLVARKPLMTS